MKDFICRDFLLGNDTAKMLFHGYAVDLPIIDYHCHVDPKEIAEDRRFDNIAQIWLGGDHYKWRLMRANGEDEKNITGQGSDYEKFMAFARALPKAVNNPLYHWAHLELRRYFNCDLALSSATADEIWHHCSHVLFENDMSVRGIIARSKVKVIATTDDPVDSLEWHKAIAEDKSFVTKVVPTFRPDKALNIDKAGFSEYIAALGSVSGIHISTLDDLFSALSGRMDFFGGFGCRASDHGLDYVPFIENAETYASAIFKKARNGESLSAQEAESYKTAVMVFLGREYAKRGWVMQLHYGAMRNVNVAMYRRLGPDTGYDAIGSLECSRRIASLLNALEEGGELPKTILYSLNPNDDAMLDTVAGCFPGPGIVSKVQHGSAWWFNDTKSGMEAQLTSLSTRGLLGGFVGMLTDSRSFLSYTRHEYFRRILCNLIGSWVENGEYPKDEKALGELITDIGYGNALKYFGW
jgi:glucuronate isomerase